MKYFTEGLERVNYDSILKEAETFFSQYINESGIVYDTTDRYTNLRNEIARTGTYRHTPEELAYACKVAWRNSTRCIGRLTWNTLQFVDRRYITTARGIFEALVEHIILATNGGSIQPYISVFKPGIRIWNSQLLRYAGYQQENGVILGDPLNCELTSIAIRLGWKPPEKRTPFDILPLIIQIPGEAPSFFELPGESILEVPLSHPLYSWFAELALKWYALPVISNMALEVGGVVYTAAPFNGYYMATEIGTRNFADVERYNLLPIIAEKMGLNTRSDRTLWKDHALVVLNQAVLHSFTQQKVTIVDHHTASRQFLRHQQLEAQCGRTTYGDWGWLVPPLSGSLSPIFHREYQDISLKPNFFYQPPPWQM